MRRQFPIAIIAAVISVFVMSSCVKQPVQYSTPATIIPVNHQNFQDEVIAFPGAVVVIFHNSEFWQSVDMNKRIHWLATKFNGEAKFAKFEWQLWDDPSRFDLEMLPTVILYRNGHEIDRIKGIPPGEKERQKWNNDLELWFLSNALQLKNDSYAGDFSYFFGNSHTLKIENR